MIRCFRSWSMQVACLLLSAFAPSCSQTKEPEQSVLFITTDAPVGGETGLFDRLLVEVYPPNALEPCPTCSRIFSVDDERMNRGDASFGILARPGVNGYRVRTRLYRSAGTASIEPRRASTLEAIVALPVAPELRLLESHVVLALDDLGRQRGTLEAPIPSTPGRPPPGIVGSRFGGHPRTCTGRADEDEVCVPGGAFWMGNPRLDVVDASETDGASERVVFVSPFFLERTEVTVAAMRSSGVARAGDDPTEQSNDKPNCVYTASTGANERLPVNCLSWQRAKSYCAKRGRRLPTEAELEYVMSGLRSQPFAWGGDLPACRDAVHGQPKLCSGSSLPEPAGHGGRDRLMLGEGALLDLAGNLREYAADQFQRGDGPCWGYGVFINPRCDPPPTAERVARSVRGGSFGDEPTLLRAAQRSFVIDEFFAVSERIGFRCARDAQ